MTQPFYITTPIYYVNAEPHLGHAYTTIVADTATRFYRLLNLDTRFQTGTDEHGNKIAQAAANEGVNPQHYADRLSNIFFETWSKLNIKPDKFIRTTSDKHVISVQTFMQKIYNAGDIYLSSYGGNYCLGCERFLTNKELNNGKCPDHYTPTQFINEENYFFKMSSYQNALLTHINANSDFIRPERYKNEILAFLKHPLDDLCISRPKNRLTWGIELPFDNRFVTYVWFDALINYITGLDWPNGILFNKYWPTAQHLIAKDILKPHGIYWPTMLMALAHAEGKPIDAYLYRHLNVHGYWKIGESKMSKSLGNVVNPLYLAKIYGAEPFRYFCLREMAFGIDATFSEEALTKRYHSDLVNDLGNLFSRVMSMLHQYRDGIIPQSGQANEQDKTLLKLVQKVACDYEVEMKAFNFHKALIILWELINQTNRFLVLCKPWIIAKDYNQQTRLDQILNLLLTKILTAITVMISPIMPSTAQIMANYLGLEKITAITFKKIKIGESSLNAGTRTKKFPILFPRLKIKHYSES